MFASGGGEALVSGLVAQGVGVLSSSRALLCQVSF